jgi:ABC-type lipoprotein release transport system permease subunit
VLGRWAWRAITHQLGVVDVPTTPLLPLLLTGVFVVLLSNLVAALPMWRASRIHVASTLRAE